MAKRKIRHPQTGKVIEAESIPIAKMTDASFQVTLEDGSVILVKVDVLEVVRIPDLWDTDGSPRYLLRSTNAMAVVEWSDELRQQD